MVEAPAFLKEQWEANDIGEDMVVRRGNDPTTWNVTAGAWNRLRDGWFALLYDLRMVVAVERMCPGKMLRLMAADVAWRHRQSGGGLHQATAVGRGCGRGRPPEGPGGRRVCQARPGPGKIWLVGPDAGPGRRAVHAAAGTGPRGGGRLAGPGGRAAEGGGLFGKGCEAGRSAAD
jgi:hypothetical protein